MNKISRSISRAGATLVIASLTFLPAAAADYPTQTISLVTAAGPGGATDTLARIIARTAQTEWGQNIVVLNKPGAGGAVAAGQVKNAAPDGYTLIVSHSGAFSVNWQNMEKPTYRTDDFTYINSMTAASCGWVVRADSPYKTLKDLMAAAKEGKSISFGGLSAENKKFVEYVASKEGAKIKSISLKSIPQVLQAVLGGHVDFGFSGGSHAQYVKKGELRVLAATGNARTPDSPDVPTLKEMGYGINDCAIFMVAGPKGIPDDIVAKVADVIAKAMKTDEAVKFLEGREVAPLVMGPKALHDFVKEESDSYTTVNRM